MVSLGHFLRDPKGAEPPIGHHGLEACLTNLKNLSISPLQNHFGVLLISRLWLT
jgi:hypothetical protein